MPVRITQRQREPKGVTMVATSDAEQSVAIERWRPSVRRRLSRLAFPLIMIAVLVAGTVTSYQLSQSTERENGIAINAYDLRGDLFLIAADLGLPAAYRTKGIHQEVMLAIERAHDEISEIVSAGNTPLLLERAIRASGVYLLIAQRALSDTAAATLLRTSQLNRAAASAGDLEERAATQVEQSAHRTSVDGRVGGIIALILVVLSIALGLLWYSRRRRIEAVTVTRAETSAQFETIIENSSDLIFLTGDAGQPQYCSPSAAHFFGVTAEDFCSAPLDRFLYPGDAEIALAALATVLATGSVAPFDVRVRHADGGWRTLEMTADDLSSTSGLPSVAWHSREVTVRRALEEQLERQAFEDSLTGLANRALLFDRLGHALARDGRSDDSVAVLVLDLDGFKSINDGLGHDAGDQALKEIAARIARSARPGDTVARLGGDEFVVLLEGLNAQRFVDDVANRILDIVRQPFMLHGRKVRISASIGIAVSDGASSTPGSLLRDADIAMYAAKAGGRDRCHRFEAAMHSRANQEFRLINDLNHAQERHEFVVYYQPSIDLVGERLEGVEALLRWQHPETGLVMPEVFIPLAEQTGLIVPIGRWVLEQACAQAVSWRHALTPSQPFVMEVNVSGHQLNHESLVPDIRHILASSGLEPENLVLEITESVLMNDIDVVVKRVRELKDIGVSIAIDDFGTGYSSLAYLRQLPIDILKIDKTFVDAASAGDPGGDAILRAILELGRGLNLKTIAEGVEERSQAIYLTGLGCHSAQGFLYARPMPPDELNIRFEAHAWGSTTVLHTA
jgi:diguanylate cyclase (GGDEF)-like protein/PAS domain S-box-containing protein